MKKIHIVAIIMLLVSGWILLSAVGDVTTYSSFEHARNSSQRVKIAGQLIKNKPMIYDPEVNENIFSFYLDDGAGGKEKVLLTQPKPQDFEMSEQIVVTGSYQKSEFVADEILMKCPSKYKGQEISLREG